MVEISLRNGRVFKVAADLERQGAGNAHRLHRGGMIGPAGNVLV